MFCRLDVLIPHLQLIVLTKLKPITRVIKSIALSSHAGMVLSGMPRSSGSLILHLILQHAE